MVDDNDGGGTYGDGEPTTTREAEDVVYFEEITNRLDHDDILFIRSPMCGWRISKMKQVTIDPLYKDCPKQWMVLCFNL